MTHEGSKELGSVRGDRRFGRGHGAGRHVAGWSDRPPPGNVASTYKTLTEVEPRTIINATNTLGDANSVYKITASGSYYLDRNLSGLPGEHCIEIEADNVTIDLNGFALTGGSLDGINVNGARRNFTLRNGTVRGFLGSGIFAGTSIGGRYENLFVQGNTLDGLWPGGEAIVRNVQAISNVRNGFVVAAANTQVLFESCIAVDNTIGFDASLGADCNFTSCSARENRAQGIRAGTRATLNSCQARGNDQWGIEAGDRATILDCQSELNTTVGIRAGKGSVVSRSRASDNGGSGFDIDSESTVMDCLAFSNFASGIVGNFSMLIDRCEAVQNTTNGISVHTGSTVSNCRTRINGQHGIVVNTSCRVQNNACDGDGGGAGVGGGVRFLGSNNLIEGNNFISCENSVVHAAPFGTGNLVVLNTSRAPTSQHFNFISSVTYGPIVNVSGFSDISGVVNANHPQANFTY